MHNTVNVSFVAHSVRDGRSFNNLTAVLTAGGYMLKQQAISVVGKTLGYPAIRNLELAPPLQDPFLVYLTEWGWVKLSELQRCVNQVMVDPQYGPPQDPVKCLFRSFGPLMSNLDKELVHTFVINEAHDDYTVHLADPAIPNSGSERILVPSRWGRSILMFVSHGAVCVDFEESSPRFIVRFRDGRSQLIHRPAGSFGWTVMGSKTW